MPEKPVSVRFALAACPLRSKRPPTVQRRLTRYSAEEYMPKACCVWKRVGTAGWDRAGADPNSAGMDKAGFENEQEITPMQLDNQPEITVMQNDKRKEVDAIP